MCGIAGIWGDGSGDARSGYVERMLDRQQHRGPDGRRVYSGRGAAFGMVRLALVDLSERGQQPLWSKDGRVAVLLNGEVYNFREERRRLEGKGVVFATTTDTEVVLELYREQGVGCFRRLRGMFAVAVFDYVGGTEAPPVMHLARDAFGIKPLYVHRATSGEVAFSSEVVPMVAAGVASGDVDRQALFDYLSFGYVVQPRTIFYGVRAVEPGTVETHTPGSSVPLVERFGGVPPAAPRPQESLAHAAERLRACLDDSVALHAFADAKVGTFLSGGVDSAAIAALMARHVGELHAFTLRFPEAPELDESERARDSAQAIGATLHMIDVDAAVACDALPRFCAALDQPSVDGFNTWLVSRGAAQHVKGVLSGVGGDELFCGYPVARRMAQRAHMRLAALIRTGGRAAHRAAQLLRDAAAPDLLVDRVANAAVRRSAIATWLQPHSVFSRVEASRLTGQPMVDEERMVEHLLDESSASWRGETEVMLAETLDLRLYLQCQLLRDADALSMAHSLELRVPLVDSEVVAFSRSCADQHKLDVAGRGARYRDSGAKRVLIEATRDVLPPGLLDVRKRGFNLPTRQWLRSSLGDLVDGAFDGGVRELLDADALRAARDRTGESTRWPCTQALLHLGLWWRAVSDARSDARHVRPNSSPAPTRRAG